ncbi:hypothetical protein [Nakamurella deserti]|uniref:hypothetical protein n=1 Tax=Nakamurella deserti TaxID=2164074 RepID=UPI0013006906|nr:hypothetical protein [Nakamurella deserti]
MASAGTMSLGVDPSTPPRRLRLGLTVNALAGVVAAVVMGSPRPVSDGLWFFACMSVMTVVDYRDEARRAGRAAWSV